MIGIVLLGHAHIASETKSAVEHILGQRYGFIAVDMPGSDISDDEQEQLREAVASLDSGDGVLLMVDLYGASPSNLAFELLQPGKVEVLAGFNLPCVIKALTVREQGGTLLELAKASIEAGQQYMCLASDLIGDH